MKKLTKKQRNRIYWKAYELQAEDQSNKRMIFILHEAAEILGFSLDRKLFVSGNFMEFEEALSDNVLFSTWNPLLSIQNQRLTAWALMIAMTEDGK